VTALRDYSSVRLWFLRTTSAFKLLDLSSNAASFSPLCSTFINVVQFPLVGLRTRARHGTYSRDNPSEGHASNCCRAHNSTLDHVHCDHAPRGIKRSDPNLRHERIEKKVDADDQLTLEFGDSVESVSVANKMAAISILGNDK
jgi:hypothetical protein